MCGRFALSIQTSDIEKLVPGTKVDEAPPVRHNIAPTQNIAAVLNEENRLVRFLRWGLVPFWAKDPSIGNKMINARAETIDQKPAFRNSFKQKRCVVLASGFYEWRKVDGRKSKVPYFIKLKSGEPFTIAGLWDVWKSPEGEQIASATLVTTSPNELMKQIHNRMPVILDDESRDKWLATGHLDPAMLKSCLVPFDPDKMEAYEVSTLVNNPAFDDEKCTEPTEGGDRLG